MKSSIVLSLIVLQFISGCKLIDSFREPLEEEKIAPVIEVNQNQVCLVDVEEGQVAPQHNCDLIYWLGYWINQNRQPWLLRKSEIAHLGDSTVDLFQKVLLSQGKDTPYQDRLRAQSWAVQLKPKLEAGWSDILEQLIYLPSQELLEFESALAILTRVNGNQLQEMEQQKALLLQRQQQIDEFLKIEASMMEKREEIDQ
jgi:desulfoferrodoxin (superoxide reductase-like protein)